MEAPAGRQDSDTDTTDPNDKKPVRFRQRPPDDSDIASARAKATQIRAMSGVGVSASAITRALSLNKGAVERILAEPGPAPPPTVPSGALRDPPPTPSAAAPLNPQPEGGRDPAKFALAPETIRGYRDEPEEEGERDPLAGAERVRTPGVALFEFLRDNGVANDKAKGIARTFRLVPPDGDKWGVLERAMRQRGVPPMDAAFYLEGFKAQMGESLTSSALPLGIPTREDPVAAERARRRRELLEQIEDLRLERLLEQLRPAPASGSASPELEALRKRTADLEAADRDRRQLEAFEQRLAPITQQLADLRKATSEFNSLDQVRVDEARREVVARDKAQGELFSVLAEKAKASGSLQQIARSVAHVSEPEIQRTAISLLKEFRPAGAGDGQAALPVPPPGEADLQRVTELLGRMSPPGAP